MSERIRYINRGKKVPRRRWPVFLVGGVSALCLGWALWFFFLGGGGDSPNGNSTEAIDKNLLATMCQENDCFWLNRKGVAFDKSGKLSGNIVLSLTAKTGRRLEVGDQLIKPETLAELLFLKDQIYESLGVKLLTGEEIGSGVDFIFTTSAGWSLKLTTAENVHKTLEVLKQTLAEISKTAPATALDYIDLRVLNKIYFKFK